MRNPSEPTIFEDLHGWITTDTIQSAHTLVRGIAGINLGEFDVGASSSQRITGSMPSWFHVLAVAAPAELI
jgi:hypothetical protein